jgi:diguanylate cyclase (GGDEF)-like protein
MNRSANEKKTNAFRRDYLIMSLASLCALLATFLISCSELSYQTKLAAFILIVFAYALGLCAAIYFTERDSFFGAPNEKQSDSFFGAEIESKLLALEEANQFFGASLKPADMFRLIASRINEIVPYSACVFYLADEKKENLQVKHVVGESLKKFAGIETNARKGLTGKTFQSREPQIDEQLAEEKNGVFAKQFVKLKSGIAIPLFSGENCFGVFALYSEMKTFNQDSLRLLEAVGSRVTPLFLSSRALETSLTNALTDALTNLPNERAFFLVLENQIAESQRFREERPLTILVIDIRKFGEHNRRLGHATGDRLLVFAADKIKSQLRQMDFLARSTNDEFLVVLPTASVEIAREVIGRVEKAFVVSAFEISGEEKIHLQLSFGAASFGRDGETANQLLQRAFLRKQQAKSQDKENKILLFPKEYVK